MADAPELSRVINVIMENPELIEKISSLMKSSEGDAKEVSGITEKNEESAEDEGTDYIASDAEQTAAPLHSEKRRHNRAQLLYAMKPYLKESRMKAIDTMLSIAEILDMMRGR